VYALSGNLRILDKFYELTMAGHSPFFFWRRTTLITSWKGLSHPGLTQTIKTHWGLILLLFVRGIRNYSSNALAGNAFAFSFFNDGGPPVTVWGQQAGSVQSADNCTPYHAAVTAETELRWRRRAGQLRWACRQQQQICRGRGPAGSSRAGGSMHRKRGEAARQSALGERRT